MGPLVTDSCLRDFSDVTLAKEAPFHSIQFLLPLVCTFSPTELVEAHLSHKTALFSASAVDFPPRLMFMPQVAI